MANENFNDKKLINLARYNYFSTRADDSSVEKLFAKDKLTNDERNKLLLFLEQTRVVKPISLREMKEEVLSIVGFKSENYNGTVSRAEMEAIYKYVVKAKT